MRHGVARNLLAGYALGLVTAQEARDVERHMSNCQACTLEVDALVYAVAGLASVSANHPSLMHVAAPVQAMPLGTLERIGDAVTGALGLAPRDVPEPVLAGANADAEQAGIWPARPGAYDASADPVPESWGPTADDERAALELRGLEIQPEPADEPADLAVSTNGGQPAVNGDRADVALGAWPWPRMDAVTLLPDDSEDEEGESPELWARLAEGPVSPSTNGGLEDSGVVASFDGDWAPDQEPARNGASEPAAAEPVDLSAPDAPATPEQLATPGSDSDTPVESASMFTEATSPEEAAVAEAELVAEVHPEVEAPATPEEAETPASDSDTQDESEPPVTEATTAGDAAAADAVLAAEVQPEATVTRDESAEAVPAGEPEATEFEQTQVPRASRRFGFFGLRGNHSVTRVDTPADKPVEPAPEESAAETNEEPAGEVESIDGASPVESASSELAATDAEELRAGAEPAAEVAEEPEAEAAHAATVTTDEPADEAPHQQKQRRRRFWPFGSKTEDASPATEAMPAEATNESAPEAAVEGVAEQEPVAEAAAAEEAAPPAEPLSPVFAEAVGVPVTEPSDETPAESAPEVAPVAEPVEAREEPPETAGEEPEAEPAVADTGETEETAAPKRPRFAWLRRRDEERASEPGEIGTGDGEPESAVDPSAGVAVEPQPDPASGAPEPASGARGFADAAIPGDEPATAQQTSGASALEEVAATAALASDDATPLESPASGHAETAIEDEDLQAVEEQPERRRSRLGRQGRRHVVDEDGHSTEDDRKDDETESVALIPSQHRQIQRRGTLAKLLEDEDDDDPRALVSFDDELLRLTRTGPTTIARRTGFSPAYIPGPVEWGLERYNDGEDDIATIIDHDGLVSSNWRFWTILLSIFSAVLFGILVVGYFFVRDINTGRQELEVAQEASAQFIRFRTVTRHPDFNTRGEGYIEKAAGRAWLDFGGLPPIEREQSYIVWADNGTEVVRIGAASLLGGSSQLVQSRNLPEDVTRIIVTVESRVGEEFPSQPTGTVLLEADVP